MSQRRLGGDSDLGPGLCIVAELRRLGKDSDLGPGLCTVAELANVLPLYSLGSPRETLISATKISFAEISGHCAAAS